MILLALCACAAPPGDRVTTGAPSGPMSVDAPPPVSLTALADGVWLHSAYETVEPWGPILTNGLVVEAEGGVWMIDTAWTDEQTEQVLALVETRLGRPVTHAVFTHAHDDKMGGVAALRAAGVETYALAESNALAPSRGLVPAEHVLMATRTGDVALSSETPGGIVVFYPGPAHTTDNVVVGVLSADVLFGGCMIRPGDARDLGNTANADVSAWAGSVRAAAARFPDATVVVPSHGAPGGRNLLESTARLADR